MDRVKVAALNNALWINEVCLTHGCSTSFRDSAWLSFDPTPPFHPNAVTLDSTDQSALHYKVAQDLRRSRPRLSFAIKDSFGDLSLQPLGFHLLFEAQWIYKPPGDASIVAFTDIEWEDIETPNALVDLDRAWAHQTGVGGVFLPALLLNPNIVFIAARQIGRIVAGCIANFGAECVGIQSSVLECPRSRPCTHALRVVCLSYDIDCLCTQTGQSDFQVFCSGFINHLGITAPMQVIIACQDGLQAPQCVAEPRDLSFATSQHKFYNYTSTFT